MHSPPPSFFLSVVMFLSLYSPVSLITFSVLLTWCLSHSLTLISMNLSPTFVSTFVFSVCLPSPFLSFPSSRCHGCRVSWQREMEVRLQKRKTDDGWRKLNEKGEEQQKGSEDVESDV